MKTNKELINEIFKKELPDKLYQQLKILLNNCRKELKTSTIEDIQELEFYDSNLWNMWRKTEEFKTMALKTPFEIAEMFTKWYIKTKNNISEEDLLEEKWKKLTKSIQDQGIITKEDVGVSDDLKEPNIRKPCGAKYEYGTKEYKECIEKEQSEKDWNNSYDKQWNEQPKDTKTFGMGIEEAGFNQDTEIEELELVSSYIGRPVHETRWHIRDKSGTIIAEVRI